MLRQKFIPPGRCDALRGTYRTCSPNPTVINNSACLSLAWISSSLPWLYCSEALRSLWTPTTLPRGGNRTNVASPCCLHSVDCGQAARHCHPILCDSLLYSMMSSWAVPAAHAWVPSKHTSQCIPQLSKLHEEEEQFAVQRLSAPDRPCQECLCSLAHQPSWLHHTCGSIKGYRRFPIKHTHI